MDLKIFGTGERTILVIPGGPGLSHAYLKPVIENFGNSGFKVIAYDPLSNSENNYSMNSAVNELDEILKNYCSDNTIVFGHSFGGNVALQYILETDQRATKISTLVISNTIYSFEKYNQNLNTLKNSMPDEIIREINRHQNEKDFGEIYFNLLMNEWLPRYWCLSNPLPEYLIQSLSEINQSLFTHFVGEDPLNVTGELRKWTIKDRIDQIKIPCLFIAGSSDTVFEKDIVFMAKETLGEYYICPDSAHYPFIENPDLYFERIDKFIFDYEAQ